MSRVALDIPPSLPPSLPLASHFPAPKPLPLTRLVELLEEAQNAVQPLAAVYVPDCWPPGMTLPSLPVATHTVTSRRPDAQPSIDHEAEEQQCARNLMLLAHGDEEPDEYVDGPMVSHDGPIHPIDIEDLLDIERL